MKKIDLLNRCVVAIYKGVNWLLVICGVSTFVYRRRADQRFVVLRVLKVYSLLLSCIGAVMSFNYILMSIFMAIFMTSKHSKNLFFASTRVSVRMWICFCARCYQYANEEELIALLGELHEVFRDVCVLARHPNLFRWSHLLLCLLALQGAVRSMSSLRVRVDSIVVNIFFLLLCSTFIVAVTAIMLLFIALIACYDELHRCTRRISNDVRTLRMGQVIAGGQLQVLVEQLRCVMLQLIAVRGRMFRVTVRLIRYFRFHLLMAILYWVGHEIMTLQKDAAMNKLIAMWDVSVGLMNLAFYCSIFEIFVWKSKLSKSFWNLHLLNVNRDFDRTVDELIHRELIEQVRVAVYGIRLDMRLFCRILLITYAYFLTHFVYKKI